MNPNFLLIPALGFAIEFQRELRQNLINTNHIGYLPCILNTTYVLQKVAFAGGSCGFRTTHPVPICLKKQKYTSKFSRSLYSAICGYEGSDRREHPIFVLCTIQFHMSAHQHSSSRNCSFGTANRRTKGVCLTISYWTIYNVCFSVKTAFRIHTEHKIPSSLQEDYNTKCFIVKGP